MKNKTMISILEQLDPDREVCVEISECISGDAYGKIRLKLEQVQ